MMQGEQSHRFKGGPGHARHLQQSCVQFGFAAQDEDGEARSHHQLKLILFLSHTHLDPGSRIYRQGSSLLCR